jgi:hypothetical protein
VKKVFAKKLGFSLDKESEFLILDKVEFRRVKKAPSNCSDNLVIKLQFKYNNIIETVKN